MSSDKEYTLARFQDHFINSNDRIVSIIGAKGSSKAQPYFEPILTPDGFVLMKDIEVGDYVIGSNGEPTRVTGVYPQGLCDVYTIMLISHGFTNATLEHLWKVYDVDADSYCILPTSEIAKDVKRYKLPKLNTETKEITYHNILYIKKQPDQVSCQCISVEAEDSLYVTRDFILTHNTWSGAKFVLVQIARALDEGVKEQGLIMLNSRQQVLDIFEQDIRPELDDLEWPYYFNAQQLNLKVFNTIIHLRSADPDAVKKIESIAYHWGWGDEASYWPPETLKTFVSRIRKGMALIRITSMPDEPDASVYSFLEGLGGKMYEISLKDNPDREFADRYEKFLRATYDGAQLERYLSGKRVSLSGQGLFPVQQHHKIPLSIKSEDDLLISWDFNVEYRAVSAWQKTGINPEGYDIIGCVDSWQLKGATVYEDAIWLSEQLSKHKGIIYLHGDASGENRSAQATGSMWKTIRDVFYDNLKNVRYIVPKSNPPVKDTIQCLNWALRNNLIFFNENEKNVFMSLQAVKADKYGEIDKAMDYKEGSGARSHETDTARYAVFHYFKHVYPGAKGGFFIV